jgi:hypothetical protein
MNPLQNPLALVAAMGPLGQTFATATGNVLLKGAANKDGKLGKKELESAHKQLQQAFGPQMSQQTFFGLVGKGGQMRKNLLESGRDYVSDFAATTALKKIGLGDDNKLDKKAQKKALKEVKELLGKEAADDVKQRIKNLAKEAEKALKEAAKNPQVPAFPGAPAFPAAPGTAQATPPFVPPFGLVGGGRF